MCILHVYNYIVYTLLHLQSYFHYTGGLTLAESEKNSFVDLEHSVMRFWEENDCFNKLREKNHGHEMFRFLDGPITANNPMGIHHAWGRTLKDTFIRYKGMQGYDCRYQNGFDAQGLWVEVEVEKELGFQTKKDIEAYGMDVFSGFPALSRSNPNDWANGWIGKTPTSRIRIKTLAVSGIF